MISNESRREVAESMRKEADNWRHSAIGQMVCLDDVPAMWRDMMRRIGLGGVQPASHLYYTLANLIDVPSCRNVSEDQDRFECNECGFEMPIWDGDGGLMSFHYCPCCGSEVVPHAERRD